MNAVIVRVQRALHEALPPRSGDLHVRSPRTRGPFIGLAQRPVDPRRGGDLGGIHSLCGVALNWEAAYGKAFQIQVSNDASTWTTLFSTTTGTGGAQELSVTGSGRYLRMYGTARATQWGYSLWELQVHGT
ncbi:MAG TPA: discoidin domain-containing protein [Streptosporangiaceae bacterium]